MIKLRFDWKEFSTSRFNHLLFVIIMLFVAGPFLQASGSQRYMLFIPSVYLLAVLAILKTMVEDNRRFFILAGLRVLTFVLDLISRYHPLFSLSDAFSLFDQVVQMFFFVYFIFKLSVLLFQERKITSDTVKGGVCVYFLIGYFWANLYRFISIVVPGSFSHPVREMQDFVYFSFTTLTTIGYGDIAPMTSFAKMVASFEGIVGQLFLAVFMAKLIGLYIVQTHKAE